MTKASATRVFYARGVCELPRDLRVEHECVRSIGDLESLRVTRLRAETQTTINEV
jgi:hypothetical protein